MKNEKRRGVAPGSASPVPPKSLVRDVAEWLYATAPKPPGPPDPPLYSPVRKGPIWDANRREYEAKARHLLSQNDVPPPKVAGEGYRFIDPAADGPRRAGDEWWNPGGQWIACEGGRPEFCEGVVYRRPVEG